MLELGVEEPREKCWTGNFVVGEVDVAKVEFPTRWSVEFEKVTGEVKGEEVGTGGEEGEVVEGTGEGV